MPNLGETDDVANDNEHPSQDQTVRKQRTGNGKRNYAELLSSDIDDAVLRTAYQGLPGQRGTERSQVLKDLKQHAARWHLLLKAGFSVLLHGLGSKRSILQWIAKEQLTDGAVVKCNGWVKSLTAHKVLTAALHALLGRKTRNASTAELLTDLYAEAKAWPDRHVYIVLQSIDGPGLRSEEDQAVLAALAACPTCHLLGSIDHINAASMWSLATAAQFRWCWINANTYDSYVAETMDVPSALLGCYQHSRQRGAGAVLRSVVSSARAAYGLLVDVQREDPTLEGVDFKQLFRMCRERFLYTSESALRSALTEFIDHELLAMRQSSDGGGELLYVPMDADGLEQVAQELQSMQAEG